MSERGAAPTVSVVVCAFSIERSALLAGAVSSLRAQTRPAEEVIVVIDHAPALGRWAAVALQGVELVASRHPAGLSGARNAGVEAARGDIVAFLDDDAVAAPDWIERLQAAYADPAVIAAGGAVVPAWEGGRPRWMPEEFDWVVGCSYRGLPERPSAVRNLIGCNMSFRREIFDEIGGFAHEVGRIGTRPLGGEETELCIRLRRHRPNGRVVYEPRAAVRHRVPAARTTLGYFRARCYAEGLSKAAIARFAGAADATSSERRYTTHVLGRGVARNAREMVARRDWSAGRRAAAIVFGLSVTIVGYVVASIIRPTTPIARPST
jgi:glycosyltransferase involved in cell wall biosynthesis